MARFKDFGAGTDTKPAEPLSFKLHGEEFHCVDQIQGKVLLDLVAESNNADDPAAAAKIINIFFETVLKDDDYKRFNELLESKDKIVSVETLGEITTWLVEEYTGRPTEAPEVS